MIRHTAIAVALVLLAPCASAQQAEQPDPALLQRLIPVLQAQRNQALDMAAAHQARADGVAFDLSRALARVKELEAKVPASEEKKD
jgi:predicted outer membrane protein